MVKNLEKNDFEKHSIGKSITVAFPGEKGAYSEEAAFKFFGNDIIVLSCDNFTGVFNAVKKRQADYGIIPIENSLEGAVGQNYDLLLKSKLKINAEEILRIRHCLISNKKTELRDIKRVYSHPQALGQCRRFLERLGCELIPAYDTAGSVKFIKEKKMKDAAAVAAKRAADAYDMKILKEGIETNRRNYTRFFIIGNDYELRESKEESSEKSGGYKTSIVFALKHAPGSLFNALESFNKGKINLTKIESRPIMGKPWEYNFYADFIGREKDKKISAALRKLKRRSFFVKVLGSYRTADF